MTEVKLCCGNKPIGVWINNGFKVMCESCGKEGQWQSEHYPGFKKRAIEAWNRRAGE